MVLAEVFHPIHRHFCRLETFEDREAATRWIEQVVAGAEFSPYREVLMVTITDIPRKRTITHCAYRRLK